MPIPSPYLTFFRCANWLPPRSEFDSTHLKVQNRKSPVTRWSGSGPTWEQYKKYFCSFHLERVVGCTCRNNCNLVPSTKFERIKGHIGRIFVGLFPTFRSLFPLLKHPHCALLPKEESVKRDLNLSPQSRRGNRIQTL